MKLLRLAFTFAVALTVLTAVAQAQQTKVTIATVNNPDMIFMQRLSK